MQEKKEKKTVTLMQFTGMVLSIVFEFLGFLLFFALAGYLVQKYVISGSYVFPVFLFLGFLTGMYFMVKRAGILVHYSLEDTRKQNDNSIFYSKEQKIRERIEKAKKSLQEFDGYFHDYIEKKKKEKP